MCDTPPGSGRGPQQVLRAREKRWKGRRHPAAPAVSRLGSPGSPGPRHVLGSLSPGSSHLVSVYCLRMVLLAQETLPHRAPPRMALQGPPHLYQAIRPLPSEPPHSDLLQAVTQSPEHAPFSQPGTCHTRSGSTETRRPHTTCRASSSKAAPGGGSPASLGASPTPRPVLGSQPTALLGPRGLSLLPCPCPLQPSPLALSQMAADVGEAGGEHSPTHQHITPLRPQPGPLTPSQSLAHVALQSSAFVTFHAQLLPGPITLSQPPTPSRPSTANPQKALALACSSAGPHLGFLTRGGQEVLTRRAQHCSLAP